MNIHDTIVINRMKENQSADGAKTPQAFQREEKKE